MDLKLGVSQPREAKSLRVHLQVYSEATEKLVTKIHQKTGAPSAKIEP
jgi:hypothetical protein